jgi:hypothetical protein
MDTSRRLRAGGALGHLLLVVVLALGVFAMHTVGHPDGSAGSGMSGAAHAVVTDSAHGDSTGERVTAELAETAESAAAMVAHDSGMSSILPSAGAPSDMGMDVMELCMAVLSAWALAALLYAALVGRTDWSASVLRRMVALARPGPPPRRPSLAQLSVLRM